MNNKDFDYYIIILYSIPGIFRLSTQCVYCLKREREQEYGKFEMFC